MDTILWDAINAKIRTTDIAGAVEHLEYLLAQEKHPHFIELIGADFSNSASDILSEINAFIKDCQSRFELKAVYLEMNGFDINPDCWYFDLFGYDDYSDIQTDSDWLCDWSSTDWPKVVLHGLESVQTAFEEYHRNELWKDDVFERPYEIAELLVLCKFMALVESALKGVREKDIPIIATAHDFDIFAQF